MRGLRQEDPISLYFFVLCIEKFSLYINQLVESGQWLPMHLFRGGPRLSHLLFADDVMLFCEAKNSQVHLVMKALNDFCEGSGLKVNVEKFKAMCSKNISCRHWDSLTSIPLIRFANDLGKVFRIFFNQG